MSISIIIVNYKVKDLLDKTLSSLFEFNKNIELDVIVVDNDSNDGSEDMVKINIHKLDMFNQVEI